MNGYDLKITGIHGHSKEEAPGEWSGGFSVQWTGTHNGSWIGFGIVSVQMSARGQITIDNEYMSDEFNEALFAAILKQAIRPE